MKVICEKYFDGKCREKKCHHAKPHLDTLHCSDLGVRGCRCIRAVKVKKSK